MNESKFFVMNVPENIDSVTLTQSWISDGMINQFLHQNTTDVLSLIDTYELQGLNENTDIFKKSDIKNYQFLVEYIKWLSNTVRKY